MRIEPCPQLHSHLCVKTVARPKGASPYPTTASVQASLGCEPVQYVSRIPLQRHEVGAHRYGLARCLAGFVATVRGATPQFNVSNFPSYSRAVLRVR